MDWIEDQVFQSAEAYIDPNFPLFFGVAIGAAIFAYLLVRLHLRYFVREIELPEVYK